jgi:hypothetical protein
MAPAEDATPQTPENSEISDNEECSSDIDTQIASETQALDEIEEALEPEFLNEKEQIEDFLRRLDASIQLMMGKLVYERSVRRTKHKQRVIRRLAVLKGELVKRLEQLATEGSE